VSALQAAEVPAKRGRRRTLGESHVQRDHEQYNAAGSLQGRERHAELGQDWLAEQGEEEDDHGGNGHRLDRDRAPLGTRHVGRQRGEQHRRIYRADDRKKGGERGERGFEHGVGFAGFEGAGGF